MLNYSGLNVTLIGFLAMLITVSAATTETRAPTEPLEKRVKAAELIFPGTVINKKIDGEWARAELLVDSPLRGVEKGQKIEVIWRMTLGGTPIYDAAEGQQGVALLGDKHEGRYWLRDDKFEDLDKLEKIEELLGADK
ncbi:MAG: hypothetical protein AAGB26_18150 [Planctomycetota bacterium]